MVSALCYSCFILRGIGSRAEDASSKPADPLENNMRYADEEVSGCCDCCQLLSTAQQAGPDLLLRV